MKMSQSRYNVGIIGYGLSAKIFHIPFIQAVSELNLYAIVQRNPKPDDDARKDHPNIKVYRSVEDLVQDSQLDLVVVSTVPQSHYQLARLALEAKKNVVIEKPFTPTSKEADELVSIAKAHGVLLTVYQNRRWDSDFLTLQHLIKQDTLGRIVEFETHYDRYRPDPPPDTWKAHPSPGTGGIYDLGTHIIDQVVCLFGLPRKITGFVGSQRSVNTTGLDDSCTILLHYDGMLATAKVSVVSPEAKQLRFWVRGEKASFKKFYMDPQEDQLKEGIRPSDASYGVEPEEHYGILNIIEKGQIKEESVPALPPGTYVEFYRKLGAALGGNISELPVDPQQAAAVIRLIELAVESSRSGKTLDV